MSINRHSRSGSTPGPGKEHAGRTRLRRPWRRRAQRAGSSSASIMLAALMLPLLGTSPLQAADTTPVPLASAAPASAGGPSDGRITLAVEEALLRDQGVFPDDVDVSTQDGIVTLKGSLSNLLLQERAVRIAESLLGVRGVINCRR